MGRAQGDAISGGMRGGCLPLVEHFGNGKERMGLLVKVMKPQAVLQGQDVLTRPLGWQMDLHKGDDDFLGKFKFKSATNVKFKV